MQDGPGPNDGFTPPDLDEEPQLTAPIGPDIDSQMFVDTAKKLFGADAMRPGAVAKKSMKSKSIPDKPAPRKKSSRR